MSPNPLLRDVVRLVREWNELDDALRRAELPDEAQLARQPALLAELKRARSALLGSESWTRPERIDREEALRELRGAGHASVELRYALARWLAGDVTLKRGRKRAGTVREPATRADRGAVSTAEVAAALLAFGSTLRPMGLDERMRGILIDLLTGRRKRTKSRGVAGTDAAKVRALIAVADARARHEAGLGNEDAITAAAKDAGVKRDTVRWHYFPRRRAARHG